MATSIMINPTFEVVFEDNNIDRVRLHAIEGFTAEELEAAAAKLLTEAAKIREEKHTV